jgi:hypothetical protein
MEGTHSTERREPNTTSICRRDCLKGEDHGQCSTPEKHASSRSGFCSPGENAAERAATVSITVTCSATDNAQQQWLSWLSWFPAVSQACVRILAVPRSRSAP